MKCSYTQNLLGCSIVPVQWLIGTNVWWHIGCLLTIFLAVGICCNRLFMVQIGLPQQRDMFLIGQNWWILHVGLPCKPYYTSNLDNQAVTKGRRHLWQASWQLDYEQRGRWITENNEELLGCFDLLMNHYCTSCGILHWKLQQHYDQVSRN
jgi:hypothetical protein